MSSRRADDAPNAYDFFVRNARTRETKIFITHAHCAQSSGRKNHYLAKETRRNPMRVPGSNSVGLAPYNANVLAVRSNVRPMLKRKSSRAGIVAFAKPSDSSQIR